MTVEGPVRVRLECNVMCIEWCRNTGRAEKRHMTSVRLPRWEEHKSVPSEDALILAVIGDSKASETLAASSPRVIEHQRIYFTWIRSSMDYGNVEGSHETMLLRFLDYPSLKTGTWHCKGYFNSISRDQSNGSADSVVAGPLHVIMFDDTPCLTSRSCP